jgi:Zn-dependent protease
MQFTLFGIPVHVQPIFWLVALMLGAPDGTSPRQIAVLAIWMVVLFVSILAHELGHAFAMRAYGRQPSIELWGLGGLTHWGEGPAVTPGKDIIVSLSGPAAGLLLGALVFSVTRAMPPAEGSLGEEAVRQALWVNIGWGLVNLVPVLPLDGGHVLKSCASWWAGARGRRIAHAISLLLAAGIVLWALAQRQLWIAFLGAWCAMISYKAFAAEPADGSTPQPEGDSLPAGLEQGVQDVWRLLMEGRADEGVRAAENLLEQLPADASSAARILLFELLAWARLEAGDERGAVDAAKQIPGRPSDLLEGRLMIADGRVTDGLVRLEQALERGRSSMPALVLSSVYIDQDRPDLTLAMLRSKRGSKLSADTHRTLCAQLFYAGKLQLCSDACKLGFERFGNAPFAYNAACCMARLGRIEEGLDWLGRSLDAGFDDGTQLDTDPDIEALRADPRFEQIRSRLGSTGRG